MKLKGIYGIYVVQSLKVYKMSLMMIHIIYNK